jgi:hypothetical protein
MPIPEAQLETWSHIGASAQSAATYNSIKTTLESGNSPYHDKRFEVFLQGSYANDTNIYADSDVDLVIRLDSVFYHDLDDLTEQQRAAFDQAHSAGSMTLAQFKASVAEWLQANYGQDVVPGNKAIYIRGRGARREADVLPAAQFRRYHSFTSHSVQRYTEGICFFLPDGTRIENYPKLHIQRCTEKHQATNQRFKRNVRVWKNLRNAMVDGGLIPASLAPSYYLEGLLHNVPSNLFVSSFATTFLNIMQWLQGADKTQLLCANGMFYLLRDNSHMCWRPASCDQFLKAAQDFWDAW